MIDFINNLDIIVILDSIINRRNVFLDDKYAFFNNMCRLHKFIIRVSIILIARIIWFCYSVITITLKAIVIERNCSKLKLIY